MTDPRYPDGRELYNDLEALAQRLRSVEGRLSAIDRDRLLARLGSEYTPGAGSGLDQGAGGAAGGSEPGQATGVMSGAITPASIAIGALPSSSNMFPDPTFDLAGEGDLRGWDAIGGQFTVAAVSQSTQYKRGPYRLLLDNYPTGTGTSQTRSDYIPVNNTATGGGDPYLTLVIEHTIDNYTSGTVHFTYWWYDSTKTLTGTPSSGELEAFSSNQAWPTYSVYRFKPYYTAAPTDGTIIDATMPVDARYLKIGIDDVGGTATLDWYITFIGLYRGLTPDWSDVGTWDAAKSSVSINSAGIVIRNGALLVKDGAGYPSISDGVINSPSGKNLVVNGSFEKFNPAIADTYTTTTVTGTGSLAGLLYGGWQSNATAGVHSVAALSSANAKTGDYILAFKTDGASSNSEITQFVPVEAGKTYLLSGWAWKGTASGQPATLTLHSVDSNHAVVGYTQATAVSNAATSPSYGQTAWTCPNDGTVAYARVSCRASNTPGFTEVFAFEDVRLEELVDETRPGGNLLVNPSFEQRPPRGFDNWTPGFIPGWIYRAGANAGLPGITGGDGNNMIGANTTGYARTGTHALQIRGNGSQDYPAINQDVPVRPGMTYRLSAYLAVGAGTSIARCRADSLDKNGTLVTTGVLDIQHNTASMTFKEDATFTAPTNGTVSWLRVYCYMSEAAPPATDTCVFEDVSLEEFSPGLENTPGEVLIDSSGVTVINGAITVASDSGATVIIDGTSQMFKIAATGLINLAGVDGTGSTGGTTSTSLYYSTGITTAPAFLGYRKLASYDGVGAMMYLLFDNSNGFANSGLVTDREWIEVQLHLTNQTRVIAKWNTRLDRSADTHTYRHYVVKETAF